MRTRLPLALTVGALIVLSVTIVHTQGRGGAQTTPAVPQITNRPPVDQAAHDRGRTLWAMHCVTCHGTQARGSETGPNIIRTRTVNFDRSAQQAGSVLGPYLKAGHSTQSGKASASFTDEEVVALANFLRQRVNDTMRGSALFTVGDIVVGDAKAGEAYFNGAGGCTACHTATTRSLAGIASRYSPVDLQQRMLFPSSGRGGGRGGAPNPNAVTMTISPALTPGSAAPADRAQAASAMASTDRRVERGDS